MTGTDAYNQLVSQYNGQSVNIDGADAGQCTAVAHALQAIAGTPRVLGNAIDTFNNAPAASYNKGTTWPAPIGACVVFGAAYGDGDGHTGASDGQGNLFEQNDPDGSVAHVKAYTDYDYIGYFIPNNYEESDMQDLCTEQNVKDIIAITLGQDVSVDPNWQGNIGEPFEKVFYAYAQSPAAVAFTAQVRKWQATPPAPTTAATVLAPGLYQVN
jgi:hypothetical protein